MTDDLTDCVCADCGYKQFGMFHPCNKCRSFRVIAQKAAEAMCGLKWELAFVNEGNDLKQEDMPPGVTLLPKG
jgi:hypothetical protein